MINPKNLYWGRACKNDETHGSERGSLRIKGYGCARCDPRWAAMTDDEVIHWFNHEQKIPDTPEQRRLKQIELSKAYQRNNPERVKKYHKEYESREEIAQRRRERYKNMDPVKKEEYLRKQRERMSVAYKERNGLL